MRFAMQRGEALLRLNRAEDAELQLIEAEGLVRDWLGEKHKMRNKVRVLLRETLTAQNRADEAARVWPDVAVE